MFFPANIYDQLGYLKVVDRLISYSVTDTGQEWLRKQSIITHPETLRRHFEKLRDMLKARNLGCPQINPMTGIDHLLPRLSTKGLIYEPVELAIWLEVLSTASEWISFLKSNDGMGQLADEDILDSFPSKLFIRLSKSISPEGEVLDSASPDLKNIRNRLGKQDERCRSKAYAVYKDISSRGWVPDGSSVGIRGGRYVVPVKAEHKRQLRGYIQDESSSGHIAFIEPEEVVQLSNEMMELRQEERREIFKILSELSYSAGDSSEALRAITGWITELDILRARSELARTFDLVIPEIVDDPLKHQLRAAQNLNLVISSQAEGRDVVPLDIHFSDESRLVVISGPNAGGKSVALKTIGLAQLMFQHGLPVKAQEGTRMPVYTEIFCDIGDNQSIENDLSTYSSHLMAMRTTMESAGSFSLVLFDEFGSGTDPRIGGAIAEVVLKELLQKKCMGVITTHYSNIKEFADSNHGVSNARMQFDSSRMLPLYRLEMGEPGSSFAIEIAKKTGFSAQLLQKASELAGADLVELEVLLARLQQQSADLDRKEKEITDLREKLDSERTRYVDLKHKLEAQKKEILRKAAQEAEWMVENANREIEKTIRHIKTSKAHKDETKKVREKLAKRKQDLGARREKMDGTNAQLAVVKTNDRVNILGYSSPGVVKNVGKKDAEVVVGSITIKVGLDKLSPLKETAESVKQQRSVRRRGIDITMRKAQFSAELDIRGNRAEEALAILDKFIDDAILLGQSELRILHGKGDGILRSLVQSHLKKIRQIERFHEEHPDRGGAGITIAYVK